MWDWQEVLLQGCVWKGGGVVVCLCCPLEKELTGSAGETRGANVKIWDFLGGLASSKLCLLEPFVGSCSH